MKDNYIKLAEKYLIPPDISRPESDFVTPVIVRAEGERIFDLNGKTYLDFNSGQMGSALGHNHPILVNTINKATSEIIHCAKNLIHPPQVLLAKALADLVDRPLIKSMFLLSGTDATSAALIMASLVTKASEFGAMDISYHGSHGIARALSFAFQAKNDSHGVNCIQIPAPYCYRCPVGTSYPACGIACLEIGLKKLRSSLKGPLAAVIVEPVMSSGGVVEAPPGYLKLLGNGVKELGGIFILDEAQTGLGKIGALFGYQKHNIVPDILILGKHFGAGIPISAVITTKKIASLSLARGFMVVGSHFSDPFSCMAGLASLEILKKENLVERAEENGKFVGNWLNSFMERHEIVGDIRGRGGLFGIEMVKDRLTKEPAVREADVVAKRCLELGLIIGVRGVEGRRNVLRLVPPLICSRNALEEGLNILERAMSAIIN